MNELVSHFGSAEQGRIWGVYVDEEDLSVVVVVLGEKQV